MSDKRSKRTFTTEQKLAILAEAADKSVTVTLDKHATFADQIELIFRNQQPPHIPSAKCSIFNISQHKFRN